jgi:hypothetical protein
MVRRLLLRVLGRMPSQDFVDLVVLTRWRWRMGIVGSRWDDIAIMSLGSAFLSKSILQRTKSIGRSDMDMIVGDRRR